MVVGAARRARNGSCDATPRLGPHRDGRGVEGDVDRAVEIRAKRADAPLPEPIEELRCGMPVVVVRPDADARDRRSRGVEERLARRRPRAVMGDLQDVDTG
jgi:hypothetical protein